MSSSVVTSQGTAATLIGKDHLPVTTKSTTGTAITKVITPGIKKCGASCWDLTTGPENIKKCIVRCLDDAPAVIS
jgi:hypothetical protein